MVSKCTSLESIKGVGQLRQEDSSHGSQNQLKSVTNRLLNQLTLKIHSAEARNLYQPSGQVLGFDEEEGALVSVKPRA